PTIKGSRQALLSSGAASCGRPSCYPSPDSSRAVREDQSQTTICRGYLSEADTHLDDFWLGTHRDSLVDMLSCWWGEVGWQLPRATTREELRAALEPLREHSNRHRISRLLLASFG